MDSWELDQAKKLRFRNLNRYLYKAKSQIFARVSLQLFYSYNLMQSYVVVEVINRMIRKNKSKYFISGLFNFKVMKLFFSI